MKPFWKREPTVASGREEIVSNSSAEQVKSRNVLQMITTFGEEYYAWDGKMYESDIIRACIRPNIKAISKLVGKHIRDDPQKGIVVNPETSIRFLLSEPNPYMTASQMQEKIALQYYLNNNAFILLVRDENGCVVQQYPIPCVCVETLYDKNGRLWLRFQYKNGNTGTFPYSDIIHLRTDYNSNEIFGDSPAPALTQMMNVVGMIDQGIIKAIKNSGIVRWLLTFTTSMRDEDIKRNVKKFVENYLDVETDTFGAAGVDAKANVQRIEPKDYVPNAAQTDRTIERIYSFFNTNKKIVQSSFTEDEWIAYYESNIEPFVVQMQQAYTRGIFSRKARGFGNYIVFEAKNLQCASLKTKLEFQAMVDRGAMLPNEWREIMSMGPVEGGDVPIRRLDTQVVNMIQDVIAKMDQENFKTMADIIIGLLNCTNQGGEKQIETQD